MNLYENNNNHKAFSGILRTDELLIFFNKLNSLSRYPLVWKNGDDGSITISSSSFNDFYDISVDISDLRYLSRNNPKELTSFIHGLCLRAEVSSRKITFLKESAPHYSLIHNRHGEIVCLRRDGIELNAITSGGVAELINEDMLLFSRRLRSADMSFKKYNRMIPQLRKSLKLRSEFISLISSLKERMKRVGLEVCDSRESRISESRYFIISNGEFKFSVRISMHESRCSSHQLDLDVIVSDPSRVDEVVLNIESQFTSCFSDAA